MLKPNKRLLSIAAIALCALAMNQGCLGTPPLVPPDSPDCQGDACDDPFIGPIDQDQGGGGSSCFAGQRECVDELRARECLELEGGATAWGVAEPCGEGVFCVGDGECCEQVCVPGERECDEQGVRTCEQAPGECPRLGAPVACPAGQLCGPRGACVSGCVSECQPGSQRCFPEGSPAFQRCVEVEPGCHRYEANERMCASGQLCTAGQCATQCNHSCPTLGAQRCVTGQEQECRANAQGCRVWANTGGRCCTSTTLGRDVVQGTCVQVNASVCNMPRCAWAVCNNGTWDYCITHTTCAADRKFPHAVCQ